MEEAWELAVVSDTTFTDWSGRHTRLRYQSVLSSFVFFLAAWLGICSVSIPGVVTFEGKLPDPLVLFGLACFCAFSIVSFHSQHKVEKYSEPDFTTDLHEVLSSLKDLIGDDEYGVAQQIDASIGKFPDGRKGISFTDEMAEFRDAYSDFSHWRVLETDVELILDGKTEVLKLSPGELSTGSRLVKNIERVKDHCMEIQEGFKTILNFSGRSNWDSEVVFNTTIKLRQLKNNLNNLPNDINSLKVVLNKYSKVKKFHASHLSYNAPLIIAVTFLVLGIVFIGDDIVSNHIGIGV